MIIHQWVPAAHRGDAVGDNALVMRGILRDWGHDSELFALSIDERLNGDVLPWVDTEARRADITIFHYAIPSPMTQAFGTLPGGRVLHYHNVTPAHFFAPFDAGICRMASLGRRQVETLADRTDLALGVSEYNREELDDMGFPRTDVLPIVVDTDRLRNARPVPALEVLLKDGLANTIMLIETGHEVGPWLRGGPSTVRGIEPTGGQLTGDGLPFGGTHFRQAWIFASPRPVAFHILLADSSVREAKNAIDPAILAALATVAGGEEIPAGW